MPDRYGKLIKNGVNYSHDTAASISYVNTTSGLTATDIQAAIDEIVVTIPDDYVSKANGGTFEKGISAKGNISITAVSGSTAHTISSNAYGTTEQVGQAILSAGNANGEGTDGNARGRLSLYSNGTGRMDIYAADNMSTNRIIHLPNPSDNDGVLALQSDIPDDFVSKANGGTFEKSISSKGNIGTIPVSGSTARYITVEAYGTTGQVGAGILCAGNDIAEGTEGNCRGRLRLYSNSKYRVDLYSDDDMTADRTLHLPPLSNNSGVLALQSDIPDDFVSKANGGTFEKTIASEGNIKSVAPSGSTSRTISVEASGTTATMGEAYLIAGNDTASGTTGNSRGRLRLYSDKNGYADLLAASGSTATRTIRLPDGAGTLARANTDDVKNVQQNYIGASGTNSNYRVLYSTNPNDTNGAGQVNKGGLIFNPGNWTGSVQQIALLGIYHGSDRSVATIINASGSIERIQNGHQWSMIDCPSEQTLYLQCSVESNYRLKYGVFDSRWTFAPYTDGGHSTIKTYLGSPNFRWSAVYAVNGTIDTSDRNQKDNIKDLTDSAKDFIMDLKPVSYKLKNNDESNGHDRTHYGLIAQDVEDTMTKMGMTALDFGGFCKDQKTVSSEEDPNTSVPVEGEYTYGLRYTEFIAPLIKTVQLQEQRINELEDMIKELQK